MKGALDIHRELLGRGVSHEIVRLPRMILTADELADALGLPAAACRVVKVFLADDRLVGALLPPGQLPSPAALLTATGAEGVRLAPMDVVNAATDYAAGLVALAQQRDKQARESLRQARETLQSLGEGLYLPQVEQALASLGSQG